MIKRPEYVEGHRLRACPSVHLFPSYPEGAVGHIDLPPGDDDGVFDGLDRRVDAQVGAVAFVRNFNVDGAAFSVLSRSKVRQHRRLLRVNPDIYTGRQTLQTCA